MKKKSFLIGFAVGLLAFSAFAAPVLSGGYEPADTDNSDVMLASRYLANEVSTESNLSVDVVDIQAASTQVVAGINYRLCLSVTVNDDHRRHLSGVVYKPLSGGLLLTRWSWVPSCYAQGKGGL